MKPPSRILIIRLSAIGDNVMATPLARCLRESYPDAEIDWLVEPVSAQLLSANSDLNEIIVWPRKDWQALWRGRQWRELWRRVKAFRRRLRAKQYDWVLDAQGLLKSGVLARMTGAPFRAGLGSKEGSQHLMHQVIYRRHDHPLIGGEYYDMLTAIGVDTRPFALHLGLPAAAEQQADAVIQQHDLASGFLALVPFTTRPQKHWFEASWGHLADELHARFGLPLVVLGGPGDAAAAKRIAQSSSRARLVGRSGDECLSLIDAAALIKRAKAVIGVDTGMTHMGSALKRPTVALFGSTVPYTDALSNQTRVLYHDLACAPCRKHPTCGGEFTCMRRLTVTQVADAVTDLIGPADG